jgi:hypothetical protein
VTPLLPQKKQRPTRPRRELFRLLPPPGPRVSPPVRRRLG